VIFQKMQVVVQKNIGQTIPQLCHVSRAREQRAAGCCKNAAIQVHEKQLMKRKDTSGATELGLGVPRPNLWNGVRRNIRQEDL
jgi:hypothetical protein